MVAIYILLGLCFAASVVSIFVSLKSKGKTTLDGKDKKELVESFDRNIDLIARSLAETQKVGNLAVVDTIKHFQDNLTEKQEALEKRVMALIDQLDRRMQEMRDSNDKNIKNLQEDNSKQLEQMRAVVDEKLSKTLEDRFKQTFQILSEQLENVYKSLGEMKNLQADVGSLTKVLSNVKTTGVFGEMQLGSILAQVLSKDQYDTNVVTGEGREPVEFAIKFPVNEDGDFAYLPIDSKFPLTIYRDLQEAVEKNDVEAVKQKRDQLKNTIRSMAKDIKTKYISAKTTDFAIMFLPIEGLYGEVVNMQGMIDELNSKYNVTIAGPTTMCSLLNSIQIVFRTLYFQKKSSEVWAILNDVRVEFGKFTDLVGKIQKQFNETSKNFDELVGTRSRVMQRKLNKIESVEAPKQIITIENEAEE